MFAPEQTTDTQQPLFLHLLHLLPCNNRHFRLFNICCHQSVKPFLCCLLTICEQTLRNPLLLFIFRSREQSKNPPPTTGSIFDHRNLLTMDYRAQGRFPNYRNRNFMNQWVPEPWETRWSFSLYGAAQHFTTYPRGYYQGLSSIDEYLLNPGNSSRPTHGHDFPSRDEYATKIPHRMRNGFFGSFESQNTKQGSDPLSYSQYSSNADQYRTRPFPYSFSGAPTPVNGGPRTSSRPPSVAYPDSVEEVCIFRAEHHDPCGIDGGRARRAEG